MDPAAYFSLVHVKLRYTTNRPCTVSIWSCFSSVSTYLSVNVMRYANCTYFEMGYRNLQERPFNVSSAIRTSKTIVSTAAGSIWINLTAARTRFASPTSSKVSRDRCRYLEWSVIDNYLLWCAIRVDNQSLLSTYVSPAASAGTYFLPGKNADLITLEYFLGI